MKSVEATTVVSEKSLVKIRDNTENITGGQKAGASCLEFYIAQSSFESKALEPMLESNGLLNKKKKARNKSGFFHCQKKDNLFLSSFSASHYLEAVLPYGLLGVSQKRLGWAESRK